MMIFHYYLFLFSSLSLLAFYRLVFFPIRKIKAFSKTKDFPPVSIVIAARNEGENLEKLIPLILKQNYQDFEIIIVNDSSSDNTENILKSWKRKTDKLRILNYSKPETEIGKKGPLSYGIEHAKHEQLLLTDADCIPASDYWVALMMQPDSDTESPDLTLGIGWYKTGNNWIYQLIQMDTILIAFQYIGWALKGKPYMSVGRNVAYKKSLWKSVNGFTSHQHISSGDDDLFVQSLSNQEISIGLQVSYDATTISKPENNFKDWLQQKKRHYSTGEKYKFSDLFRLGLFQLLIVLFYYSAIFNLLNNNYLETVLTILVLKFFTQFLFYRALFKKLRLTQNITLFLVFELLWVILNVLWLMSQLITKKKAW